MNKWLKIGAYLMLLLLLTAEDCADNVTEPSQEERQSMMYIEMENKFEKDQLAEEDLTAFENRSLQMLSDFIDYINIYADSSLIKDFRLQSRQMIDKFFLTVADRNSLFLKLNLVEDEKKGILLFRGTETFNLKLDAHIITGNLSQQTDFTYSGEIKFNVSSNIAEFKPQENNIVIHLKKSQKQFGENTMEVWGVFFGGIN